MNIGKVLWYMSIIGPIADALATAIQAISKIVKGSK